ncbi:5617_t:CDS:2 [Gigaspora margarita]|uniref:5617_t:CDS:1 n=1 Tax=Gigaspora margarita TaxID=4874 RepID=A0ABN7V9P3_GIGMA|nr:5617_t:CDS:2 [Gigaspora margarita]
MASVVSESEDTEIISAEDESTEVTTTGSTEVTTTRSTEVTITETNDDGSVGPYNLWHCYQYDIGIAKDKKRMF